MHCTLTSQMFMITRELTTLSFDLETPLENIKLIAGADQTIAQLCEEVFWNPGY